jgi:release factor glutamine methyltransferase
MPLVVDQALAQALALGLDRLDARLLLAHHLRRPPTWPIAHGDAVIPGSAAAAFALDCTRRADGWPLAYLLGEREFFGLSLHITPDVLVPRPDTETLVDWALECLARHRAAPAEVLDLGTGSGAIALALAHARRDARICATDLSVAALRVARANAVRLGLAVGFEAGHWWLAVPGRRFDLVVSNPPYVADTDPHLPALRHEPGLALRAGADGLDAIRQIVAGAPQHLNAGGWLLLEHGCDQASAIVSLLTSRGFADTTTRSDLAARPRCTGGRWPEAGIGVRSGG